MSPEAEDQSQNETTTHSKCSQPSPDMPTTPTNTRMMLGNERLRQALNVQLVGPPILRKARMWHVLACRHQNATAIHMRASVCACVCVCIRLCGLFVCVCARECVRLYVPAKTKKQTMAKAVSFQRRCLKTMEHHATESMKVQPHKPFELAWNVGNADACLQ